MKIIMLSILFFGVLTISKAQKLDTIYFDSKWAKTDKFNKHYYRVIKEDAKHGVFYVSDFYNDGVTQMKGTYSSMNPETRNGEFVWFYPNGKKKMKANFENGEMKKNEEWDESGNLKKKPDIVKAKNLETGEEYLASIERAPSYRGGMSGISDFLSKNIKYPNELVNSGIKGKVLVRFVVSKEGKVKDSEVIQSIHPLLDAEAIRVVKLMKNWEPGKQNGELVDVKLSIAINFN